MPETKIIVLDDDPTGSQTVHGCLLLTRWDVETLRQGLADASPLLFILTNSRGMGAEQAAAVIAKYRLSYPSAMACLADDLAASLNHLKLPARLRPLVRSSNGLERAFEEERRRSKTIPHFFGEKPCLKLMYGVLARVSGRWTRVHYTATELEQIAALRASLGLAPWK